MVKHDASMGDYMQRVRDKVLEILSCYLATFKEKLMTKYEPAQTDGKLPGALDTTTSYANQTKRDRPQNLESVVQGETLTRENCSSRYEDRQTPKYRPSPPSSGESLSSVFSEDDWVFVGRCVSGEKFPDFACSPPLISASSATSVWSSDPEAEIKARNYSPFPTSLNKRAVKSENSLQLRLDTANDRIDSHDVVKCDQQKNFKKTNNPRLIKGSAKIRPSTSSKDSSQLLPDSENYREQHFRAPSPITEPKAADSGLTSSKVTSSKAPQTPVDSVPDTHLQKNPLPLSTGQPSQGGTASKSQVKDQTYIGGVPVYRFLDSSLQSESAKQHGGNFSRASISVPNRQRRPSLKYRSNKAKRAFLKLFKPLPN
ncbi:uncharacterized protein [Diadema setosum]